MTDKVVVGNISFGPHREQSTAGADTERFFEPADGPKFVLQMDGGIEEIEPRGLRIGDTGRIARLQEDVQRLCLLLAECAEFLDGQADVLDSPDGPVPNRAMSLAHQIDQELVGRKL